MALDPSNPRFDVTEMDDPDETELYGVGRVEEPPSNHQARAEVILTSATEREDFVQLLNALAHEFGEGGMMPDVAAEEAASDLASVLEVI